jgi:hypothetical protein
MEWEGKVGAPQPMCALSGRVLEPGETVFSALVLADGGFARRDIAAEAWPGADRDGFLSWWRRTVPEPKAKAARLRLDQAVLQRLFSDLAGREDAASIRLHYIVALCLLRARKLALERVERDADGAWLLLAERGGTRHRIRDPALTPADAEELTGQLLAVAGEDAAAPAPA